MTALIVVGLFAEILAFAMVALLWFPLRKSGLVNSLLWIIASAIIGRLLFTLIINTGGPGSVADVVNSQPQVFISYFSASTFLIGGLKTLAIFTLLLSNAAFLLEKTGVKTRPVALMAKAYPFDFAIGVSLLTFSILTPAVILILKHASDQP